MKHSVMKAVVAGVSLLCATGMVMAQSKVDFGKREYDSNCAACHGIKGKGDGPSNPYLTSKTSSDLTLLSKKNQGVFPYQRVYEVVDGRHVVVASPPALAARNVDTSTTSAPTWTWTRRKRRPIT